MAAGTGLCNDSQQEQELCLPVLGTAARAADLKGAQSRVQGEEEVFHPRDEETECTGLGAEHLHGLPRTKSRQDGERDTVSHWEFMQHECCGTSQGSGFGGLIRARKAPLDLLGKWVCEELWEISAVLLAKQTHCLASWPGRTTTASIVLGKGLCPSPALQKSRECLSSSEQSNVPAKTSC